MQTDFSERLKKLRMIKGWSKVKAASLIGVTPGAYGNWEYGNREPNLEYMKKISKVFGVSTSYLIDGKYMITDSWLIPESTKSEIVPALSKFKEPVLDLLKEILNDPDKRQDIDYYVLHKLIVLLNSCDSSEIKNHIAYFLSVVNGILNDEIPTKYMSSEIENLNSAMTKFISDISRISNNRQISNKSEIPNLPEIK